jgi:hypothetical protein
MATPKHTPAKARTAVSEIAIRLASELGENLNSRVVDHRMRLELLKSEEWWYEDLSGAQHAGSELPEDVLMSPERSQFDWGKGRGFQVQWETHTSRPGWLHRDTRTRRALARIPSTEMYRIEVLKLMPVSPVKAPTISFEPATPNEAPPGPRPPKVWLPGARAQHPRRKGQGPTEYAKDMVDRMEAAHKAGEVTAVHLIKTMVNRLAELAKAEKEEAKAKKEEAKHARVKAGRKS